MVRRFLASALVLCGLPLFAAEPTFEKVDVFTAGTGGYAHYRIPGIVVTAKGTVLAYSEARKTTRGDWGTIRIFLRRSTDGGKTWSPAQDIANVDGPYAKNPVALAQNLATPDEITYNNPVAIADRKNNTIHFLFCLEYMRAFYMRSTDDGVTFSKPVEITSTFDRFRPEYDWKVLATGPGHGIQLRSGRLLVPVWLSTGTGGHAHRPSVTATIYSDDNGATWQRGAIAVPNTTEWVYPNETAAAELSDGRVLLNVRTESPDHRRLLLMSADGIAGWSAPRFHAQLLEPICFGSMVELSSKPSRLLFVNPDNLARADGKETPGLSRDRRNLTVKLSYDDAATWPVNRVIEPGYSGYADLAVARDGTILCFFERGAPGDNRFQSRFLTLARFNLEWLTEGKDNLRNKKIK